MFPPSRKRSSKSFSVSLVDLQSVSLDIIPARDPNEYLMIEGNHLKVLALDDHSMNILGQYKDNRVARYDIHSDLLYAVNDLVPCTIGN
jgi:hypothetical protein